MVFEKKRSISVSSLIGNRHKKEHMILAVPNILGECRMGKPSKIWSKSKMLQENAHYYVLLGQNINLVEQLYRNLHKAKGKDLDSLYTMIRKNLLRMGEICDRLELSVSSGLLKKYEDNSVKIPESLETYNVLTEAVGSELESCWFLYLETQRSEYYMKGYLQEGKLYDNFPSACNELLEAGNSYACELDTACVFHCMRAVEIGLRVVGKALKIKYSKPVELMNWEDLLRPIRQYLKELEQKKATPTRNKKLLFYSDLAAQFQHFKLGWRNKTAHARETYTGQQAKMIFEHTVEFFRTLSTQLSE